MKANLIKRNNSNVETIETEIDTDVIDAQAAEIESEEIEETDAVDTFEDDTDVESGVFIIPEIPDEDVTKEGIEALTKIAGEWRKESTERLELAARPFTEWAHAEGNNFVLNGVSSVRVSSANGKTSIDIDICDAFQSTMKAALLSMNQSSDASLEVEMWRLNNGKISEKSAATTTIEGTAVDGEIAILAAVKTIVFDKKGNRLPKAIQHLTKASRKLFQVLSGDKTGADAKAAEKDFKEICEVLTGRKTATKESTDRYSFEWDDVRRIIQARLYALQARRASDTATKFTKARNDNKASELQKIIDDNRAAETARILAEQRKREASHVRPANNPSKTGIADKVVSVGK